MRTAATRATAARPPTTAAAPIAGPRRDAATPASRRCSGCSRRSPTCGTASDEAAGPRVDGAQRSASVGAARLLATGGDRDADRIGAGAAVRRARPALGRSHRPRDCLRVCRRAGRRVSVRGGAGRAGGAGGAQVGAGAAPGARGLRRSAGRDRRCHDLLARRTPAAGSLLRSGRDRRRADVRAGAHRLLPGGLRLRPADGAAVGRAVSAGQLGRAGPRAARVRSARRAQPAGAPDAALRGGAGPAGRRGRRCLLAARRSSWAGVRDVPGDLRGGSLRDRARPRRPGSRDVSSLSTAQWVSVAIGSGPGRLVAAAPSVRRRLVGGRDGVGEPCREVLGASVLRGSIEKSGTAPGGASLP